MLSKLVYGWVALHGTCTLRSRKKRQGSQWSAEDRLGPARPVKVWSSPMVKIRPTGQSWLLKLTGPGSVRPGGPGKKRVIKGASAGGLSAAKS